MARTQARRSISLRAPTYWAVRLDCAARRQSMSDYLEGLIKADFEGRGMVKLLADAGPTTGLPRASAGPLTPAQHEALEIGRRRERKIGVPKPAAVPTPPPEVLPPAEDFPEDEPPAHMVPGAGLREPGPVHRRMDKQEQVDLRRAQREGISGGTDDPARSGRAREKTPAVVAPARGARNVVLW